MAVYMNPSAPCCIRGFRCCQLLRYWLVLPLTAPHCPSLPVAALARHAPFLCTLQTCSHPNVTSPKLHSCSGRTALGVRLRPLLGVCIGDVCGKLLDMTAATPRESNALAVRPPPTTRNAADMSGCDDPNANGAAAAPVGARAGGMPNIGPAAAAAGERGESEWRSPRPRDEPLPWPIAELTGVWALPCTTAPNTVNGLEGDCRGVASISEGGA